MWWAVPGVVSVIGVLSAVGTCVWRKCSHRLAPPPTPNPSHEECPDADAAGELRALLDHLARYDGPGKLAGHLRAPGWQVHSSEETDLAALRSMHQVAHDNTVQAARRELGVTR